MNIKLLDTAKERIPSVPVLINVISKRVRQLNSGFQPYVKPKNPNEEAVDIALREIAEGKLVAEIEFDTSAASG